VLLRHVGVAHTVFFFWIILGAFMYDGGGFEFSEGFLYQGNLWREREAKAIQDDTLGKGSQG
jgi:hypothetical protein